MFQFEWVGLNKGGAFKFEHAKNMYRYAIEINEFTERCLHFYHKCAHLSVNSLIYNGLVVHVFRMAKLLLSGLI